MQGSFFRNSQALENFNNTKIGIVSLKGLDTQLMKISEVGTVKSPPVERSTFRYTLNSSKRNGFLIKEYKKSALRKSSNQEKSLNSDDGSTGPR